VSASERWKYLKSGPLMDGNRSLTTLEVIKDPIVVGYAKEAVDFLKTLPWCSEVRRGFLAFAVPRLFAVFVMQVVSRRKSIPGRVWVVIFDEPRACLVNDDALEWQDALNDFIWEMRRWVRSHSGDASALGLEGRLDALQQEFVYNRRGFEPSE
jgi:hypothetical protein